MFARSPLVSPSVRLMAFLCASVAIDCSSRQESSEVQPDAAPVPGALLSLEAGSLVSDDAGSLNVASDAQAPQVAPHVPSLLPEDSGATNGPLGDAAPQSTSPDRAVGTPGSAVQLHLGTQTGGTGEPPTCDYPDSGSRTTERELAPESGPPAYAKYTGNILLQAYQRECLTQCFIHSCRPSPPSCSEACSQLANPAGTVLDATFEMRYVEPAIQREQCGRLNTNGRMEWVLEVGGVRWAEGNGEFSFEGPHWPRADVPYSTATAGVGTFELDSQYYPNFPNLEEITALLWARQHWRLQHTQPDSETSTRDTTTEVNDSLSLTFDHESVELNLAQNIDCDACSRIKLPLAQGVLFLEGVETAPIDETPTGTMPTFSCEQAGAGTGSTDTDTDTLYAEGDTTAP